MEFFDCYVVDRSGEYQWFLLLVVLMVASSVFIGIRNWKKHGRMWRGLYLITNIITFIILLGIFNFLEHPLICG